MRTYIARVDADEALQDGESVAATLLKDGSPVYFLVPTDTSETEMRRIAFEVRMGRTMTSFEDSLLAIVEARAAR